MTEPEPFVTTPTGPAIIKVNAQLTAEQLREFEAAFEDGSVERHRPRFLTDEDES